MTKLYTTLALLLITVVCFSQSYYVYTATTNGNWSNLSNWTVELRTDGIQKNRFVIPANRSMTADNGVNTAGFGTLELYISGTLAVAHNTTITLNESSSIQLNNGFITGSAGNQQISIGGVMKYRGNLDGSKTGASFADNTTGVSPNGFSSLQMLPVNFTTFYINKTGESIQLTWSTDKEVSNSHFDVERSFNGVDWEKVAIVFGSGVNNLAGQYNYSDKNISNAIVYYRLRQVDVNGRFVYSSVKTIRMNEAIPALKIYGSDKTVVIDLNSAVSNNLVVSILTTNGQVIKKQTFNNASYKINVPVQNAPAGTYVIQVTDGKGLNEAKKIVL